MLISLCELSGMIANVAIENHEHDYAYKRCLLLIQKFGPFAQVDWDTAIKVLYAEVKNEEKKKKSLL